VQQCRFACSSVAEEHGAISSFATACACLVLLEQAAEPINIDRWPRHFKLVSICSNDRHRRYG